MGVKVEGVETLMYVLQQGGERAVRGAIDQMRKEAEDMAELARKMAPVDEGDLEKAIRTRETGGGRGFGGRFAQKTITIEIDGSAPAGTNKEGEMVTVGDYAYIMHELLLPYGNGGFYLGPRSRRKQQGSNVPVGGKFLERAVAEVSNGLVGRMIGAAHRELD